MADMAVDLAAADAPDGARNDTATEEMATEVVLQKCVSAFAISRPVQLQPAPAGLAERAAIEAWLGA